MNCKCSSRIEDIIYFTKLFLTETTLCPTVDTYYRQHMVKDIDFIHFLPPLSGTMQYCFSTNFFFFFVLTKCKEVALRTTGTILDILQCFLCVVVTGIH